MKHIFLLKVAMFFSSSAMASGFVECSVYTYSIDQDGIPVIVDSQDALKSKELEEAGPEAERPGLVGNFAIAAKTLKVTGYVEENLLELLILTDNTTGTSAVYLPNEDGGLVRLYTNNWTIGYQANCSVRKSTNN